MTPNWSYADDSLFPSLSCAPLIYFDLQSDTDFIPKLGHPELSYYFQFQQKQVCQSPESTQSFILSITGFADWI